MPSGPIRRSGKIAPALSTSTSRRSSDARMAETAARTDASEPEVRDDDREPILAGAARGARAAEPRASRRSRPTRTTRAPSAATISAVTRPRPEVGPVTAPCGRRARPAPGPSRRTRRRRMPGPMRVKLPTTEISRRSSMRARVSMVSIVPRHDDIIQTLDVASGSSTMMRRTLYEAWTTTPWPPSTNSIDTRLPVDEAFAFVADFANAARWDPGVATSTRLDAGPVGVGSRYRLGIRMGGRVAPMEYRITTFEPSRRVVLVGSGIGRGCRRRHPVRADAAGHPDRLPRRHPPPGASSGSSRRSPGGAFARIARNARDGMQRTLDGDAAAADRAAAGERA